MKRKFLFTLIICLTWIIPAHAAFSEPMMADYTAYPIFTNQSVPPNVMIMLDNSGSMNFNAYGTWPPYVSGNPGTVSDAPFEGEPYSTIRTYPLASADDDMEEYSTAGAAPFHNGDLDMGGYNGNGTNARLAVRFQNLDIPPGAVITSATIQFTAITTTDAATYPTDLLIEGQASDDAPALTITTDYIKNMTPTAQTVAWNAVASWTAGTNYQTVNIGPILQELVNRPGWASGNAAAFRFSGSGYREAYAFEGYTGGARAPVLRVTFQNPTPKRYYGLFSPDHFYTYSSTFDLAYKKVSYDTTNTRWDVQTLAGVSATLTDADIVAQKLWDGNFLNWLSMRRIDILRKVLMGGLATARTGGGNQVNYGEVPKQTGRDYNKIFDSSGTGPAVSPYNGNYTYLMTSGEIRVSGVRYVIRVQKDVNHEPDSFLDGNLAGVLQRVGDKARWGNIWFNAGTGANQSGGTVEHTIGTNMTTLITDLQNTGCDTWTPLAESFYVAMQYFKQEDPASGLDYPNSAVPNANLGDDPYYDSKSAQKVWCAKSFVILLTDGASTMDSKIPGSLKSYSGDGDNTGCVESSNTNCDYPSGGSDYLDNIALYARTNDLRADLESEQNVVLYAIYAFDKDPNGRKLLRDAARNGGFEDRDGDDLPDGDYNDPPEARLEWDQDGDGEPDTYYEADDGYALQAKLLAAITDILRRASSGTAASVLATNAEGAGNSVQAYFRPSVTVGLEEARWLGYLQSLWVDPWGNLREDSNGNHVLDLKNSTSTSAAGAGVDKIITFFTGSTDTRVNRFTTHYMYNPDNGESDTCMLSDCDTETEEIGMEETLPLFEAGKLLSERSPITRRIFTYVDKDQDKAVDDGGDSFDFNDELISFTVDTAATIKPYLGVRNSTTWSKLGSTQDIRVSNIINYIRGTDQTGLRNRTLDGSTWRLGDIVHSTPLVVGSPAEMFQQLYKDDRYADFLEFAANRETVIYVGANDGMLHAFTNWQYATDPNGNPSYVRPAAASSTERLGDELWAYVPGSVLPHLKWTVSTDYTHTYYIDSEVRVFDADILPDDTGYSDGDGDPNFGTFLIMGLNMGGKQIQVEEDFGTGTVAVRTFDPTYTLLNITDPRNPKVMWERSYTNLGMTSSIPAPVQVGNRWFLVFGSGPTQYDGNSSHGSYIYVVDMITGNPYSGAAGVDSMWGPFRTNASFNDPLALDLFQSANVDAIFLANNYYASNQWQSEIFKIAIPCSTCSWDGNADEALVYNTNPSQWVVSRFFESDRPVTVKLSSTVDPLYNLLLFFGTGRYLSDTDKTSTTQNYLYGVKDPFYNKEKYDGSYYHDYSQSLTLDRSDLFAADNVQVTTAGHVVNSPYGLYFQDFVTGMRLNADGWYVSLLTNGNQPSERVITQSSILGGIVLTPTYTPNSEICGMGGDTALVGVYYETGTGYKHQLFDIENKNYASITIDGTTTSEEIVEIRDDNLLKGTPAPKIIFHAGMEGGARAIIQQGSGVIENIGVSPALYFKSIVTEWWDNENTP
jgi:type IV pilus assembly protein PilY1